MIGVFGGTFNPIHNGHLQLAREMIDQLKLEHIRMIPCGIPVHRQAPEISAQSRFAMVQAAVLPYPQIIADEREIVRDGPSYMVDTLASLKQEFDQPLCLILGSDAFCQLHTWKNWRQLFDFAHIAVLRRPGIRTRDLPLSDELQAFLTGRLVNDVDELKKFISGHVIFMSNRRLEISSSAIRAKVADGENIEQLVPDSVSHIIRSQSLYRVGSDALILSVEKA